MKKLLPVSLLLLSMLLNACRNDTGPAKSERPSFVEVATPAGAGGEPNLYVTPDRQAYLSWVGYENDTTDALYYAKWVEGAWSDPVKIAQGHDWFVNWADFPSLVVSSQSPQHLAAHWLQRSAAGTYDYDVRIAQSTDGGASWSASFIPHTDGIAAEHGFVSMLPMPNDRILATWLDGRNSKGVHNNEGEHGHGGAMTLRTAEFDRSGHLFEEAELDSRVCDCCQTDAALTENGPIVVYRDRSEAEVRDIAVIRKVAGHWMAPQLLYADNWEIKGCPVNGPAIAARGQSVAIAWYTAAENQPRVQMVLSEDGGDTFSNPFRVDDGAPIGRVDVVLTDEGLAVVSWLEEVEAGGEIRLAKIGAQGKLGNSLMATTTGVSRQSGFPVMDHLGEHLLLAWTSVEGTESTVRSMLIDL